MWQYQQPTSSQLQAPTSSIRISKYNWYRVFAVECRVTTGAILSFSFFEIFEFFELQKFSKRQDMFFFCSVSSLMRDGSLPTWILTFTGKNESVSDWNSFFVRNLQRKHQAKQRCQEHCLLARKLLGSTRYNTIFPISPKAKLRGPFLRPSPVFFFGHSANTHSQTLALW